MLIRPSAGALQRRRLAAAGTSTVDVRSAGSTRGHERQRLPARRQRDLRRAPAPFAQHAPAPERRRPDRLDATVTLAQRPGRLERDAQLGGRCRRQRTRERPRPASTAARLRRARRGGRAAASRRVGRRTGQPCAGGSVGQRRAAAPAAGSRTAAAGAAPLPETAHRAARPRAAAGGASHSAPAGRVQHASDRCRPGRRTVGRTHASVAAPDAAGAVAGGGTGLGAPRVAAAAEGGLELGERRRAGGARRGLLRGARISRVAAAQRAPRLERRRDGARRPRAAGAGSPPRGLPSAAGGAGVQRSPRVGRRIARSACAGSAASTRARLVGQRGRARIALGRAPWPARGQHDACSRRAESPSSPSASGGARLVDDLVEDLGGAVARERAARRTAARRGSRPTEKTSLRPSSGWPADLLRAHVVDGAHHHARSW